MRAARPREPRPADEANSDTKIARPTQVDRTTLVVRLGLVAIAIVGALSVFGDSIFLQSNVANVAGSANAPTTP